jgi:hypothetical protein
MSVSNIQRRGPSRRAMFQEMIFNTAWAPKGSSATQPPEQVGANGQPAFVPIPRLAAGAMTIRN